MEKKFWDIDALDVAIFIITMSSLAGLLFVPVDAGVKTTLTQVLWAGLVGLGLKKAPA